MNELVGFFRGMVPSQLQVQLGVTASMVGTAFTYLCGWNDLIETLMIAMVLDYATGMLAAYISLQLALNSQKGFRGIAKKVTILAMVGTAYHFGQIMSQPAVYTMVIWFYLGNEGLSIIENAAKAGIPVPTKLKNTLEQLSNEKSRDAP